jgi:hypothetical protein
MAYFGERADAARLRRRAEELRTADPKRQCEWAMVMAEVIESVQPDRDSYFITDARARGYVFGGAKWKAGWVFLVGEGDHSRLASRFKERNFLVFAQNGAGVDAVDLGPRPTAAAYFLQLMVRYAMIWGRIEPGQDHEMSHFLEADMPGVVVADGPLTPTEELLLLGLMKMGAPAAVSTEYAYDLGRQVRADEPDEIVEAAVRFPNLRVLEAGSEERALPEFCNPAHVRENIDEAGRAGGEGSFLLARPESAEEGTRLPPQDDLPEGGGLGILVRIGDARLDVPTSSWVEKGALDCISMMEGVRGEQEEGGLVVRWAAGCRPSAERLAEAVRRGLRYYFPHMERVNVELLTGAAALDDARPAVERFRAERRAAIAAESDDSVSHFHYCIECQPFSKEHVCIITPDRPPMCGRNPYMVRAAAAFGAYWHPYKRREIEDEPLRRGIEVGEPLDAERGEYRSVNETAARLTGGALSRVSLHSVREHPHTSCGCFKFLAFWLEEEGGIGVMERGYEGQAPGGLTWDHLANAAGGKQTPGVTGICGDYLRSDRFLRGDGGREAIGWLSPRACEAVADLLPDPGAVQVGD